MTAFAASQCAVNPSEIRLRKEDQGLKVRRTLSEWPDSQEGIGVMSLGLESGIDLVQSTNNKT